MSRLAFDRLDEVDRRLVTMITRFIDSRFLLICETPTDSDWRTSFQDFQSLPQLFMKHMECSKKYANHLLDTPRPVSMLVVAHFSNYCYVNKTLDFISFPPHLLFFANIFHLQPHSLYENSFFMCTLPFFTVWPMCSGMHCIQLILSLSSF